MRRHSQAENAWEPGWEAAVIDLETKAVHFGPPHSSDVREEPRRRGLAFLLGRNFHEHLRHVCRLLVHRIAGKPVASSAIFETVNASTGCLKQ